MKLLLLGTSGCHLCEQAEEILEKVVKFEVNIQLLLVDIAEQTQWQEQYAVKIPVLYHLETQKELLWRFDEDDVKSFINGLKND